MSKLLESLRGKKTYLCAVGAAIIVLLHYFGVLDTTSANVFLGLLGAAGVASLRAAVR